MPIPLIRFDMVSHVGWFGPFRPVTCSPSIRTTHLSGIAPPSLTSPDSDSSRDAVPTTGHFVASLRDTVHTCEQVASSLTPQDVGGLSS